VEGIGNFLSIYYVGWRHGGTDQLGNSHLSVIAPAALVERHSNLKKQWEWISSVPNPGIYWTAELQHYVIRRSRARRLSPVLTTIGHIRDIFRRIIRPKSGVVSCPTTIASE